MTDIHHPTPVEWHAANPVVCDCCTARMCLSCHRACPVCGVRIEERRQEPRYPGEFPVDFIPE